MPAFLTHWRILIETARHSQDAGSDLGSLITDATALRRRSHGWSTPPQTTPAGAIWDTGPLPEIDFHFPGSDISAMAFLGALAPDIMYYHPRYFRERRTDRHQSNPSSRAPEMKRPLQWSALFHRSHSGDIVIAFLEQVALVPSPALRSQALAFALGYISHIAADIALHPWIDAVAAHLPAHRALGSPFSVESRLDEYLATTYFAHPRYSLFSQPWAAYIEPAARNLSQPDTQASQMLQLLVIAAEIYHLSEEQTEALPRDFLEGLKGLRHFLAGHGRAHWLALLATRKKEQSDLLNRVLADPHSDTGMIALEKVLNYATSLSERLCRQAIYYYTALRNPQTGASERSSRRTALVSDLRNWDLYTGTTVDDSENEPPLHNWIYFADLWEQQEARQEQPAEQFMPSN